MAAGGSSEQQLVATAIRCACACRLESRARCRQAPFSTGALEHGSEDHVSGFRGAHKAGRKQVQGAVSPHAALVSVRCGCIIAGANGSSLSPTPTLVPCCLSRPPSPLCNHPDRPDHPSRSFRLRDGAIDADLLLLQLQHHAQTRRCSPSPAEMRGHAPGEPPDLP